MPGHARRSDVRGRARRHDDARPGLHGYRVYKFLGSGAFGEVWLAQDLNLPRVVAVKTLKVGAAADERGRALEALRKDAHLLTQVEHPNVVRVYAWLTVGEQHYLVMQYVAGGSLAELLKAEGPLDWQRAARYVADVGEGLLEVHAQGIVHRDVKPANILWEPKKDEALLDRLRRGGAAGRPGDRRRLDPLHGPRGVRRASVAGARRVQPGRDLLPPGDRLGSRSPASRIADLKEQIRRGLPDPDPRCAGLPEPLERIIRAGLTADPERRPGLKEFVATLAGNVESAHGRYFTMSPTGRTDPSTEVHGAGRSLRRTDDRAEPPQPAPVDLRLIVSRQVGPDRFVPVAATHPQPQPGRLTRDMKKVPPPPDQVRLRTGDRVRIEVGRRPRRDT